MGKTLTITDDELGATALVRIEQTGAQPPRVTELRFTAEPGHGLTSAALALMEDLGLRLPAQAPAAPVKARKPPAKKPVKKTPPRKAAPAAESLGPPPAELGGAQEAPALPGVPPSQRPAAPAAPQQRKAKAYRTGGPPTAEQLRESFRRHRGDYKAMAVQFDASTSSVSNWVRRAREGGARIDLAGLDAEVSP